ncbi:MAG TPA: BatD family protein, partial [Chitinivibrionales bacterium]|nr:BatD family protein [Chitinivibrionales bacterium]
MIRTFSLVVILGAFAASSAQEISFSVSADRTSVMFGDRILVTAQIVSNKQLSGSFAPQVSKSDDFDVLGTNQNSSQSTNIQLINGKMMQSVSITYSFYYSIAPKKVGSFTFPALKAVIDGKTYSSNPFAITVGKEAQQAAEVHVVLAVSKRNLYQGEQALLTVKVAQKAGAQVQLSMQGLAALCDRLEKSMSK